MKTKLIFKKWVAKELMNQGNFVIDVIPNHKVEGLKVWVFELTDKLSNDLTIATQKQSA